MCKRNDDGKLEIVPVSSVRPITVEDEKRVAEMKAWWLLSKAQSGVAADIPAELLDC